MLLVETKLYLAIGIQTVSSCKSDDSLINTVYLITTWIDNNWSKKFTSVAFSKHKFYCGEAVQTFATKCVFAASITK